MLMYSDGYFGVLEANYTLAGIMLLTGWLGPGMWHTPLTALLPTGRLPSALQARLAGWDLRESGVVGSRGWAGGMIDQTMTPADKGCEGKVHSFVLLAHANAHLTQKDNTAVTLWLCYQSQAFKASPTPHTAQIVCPSFQQNTPSHSLYPLGASLIPPGLEHSFLLFTVALGVTQLLGQLLRVFRSHPKEGLPEDVRGRVMRIMCPESCASCAWSHAACAEVTCVISARVTNLC